MLTVIPRREAGGITIETRDPVGESTFQEGMLITNALADKLGLNFDSPSKICNRRNLTSVR